ncbi:hypothetical protein D3C78_1470250 [compost metagenome]
MIRTVAKLPKEDRPPVHCIAFANNIEEIGKPQVIIDVKDFLKQKMASIQAHKSQFQAAELLGSKTLEDKEIQDRFGTEHFWIYPFE